MTTAWFDKRKKHCERQMVWRESGRRRHRSRDDGRGKDDDGYRVRFRNTYEPSVAGTHDETELAEVIFKPIRRKKSISRKRNRSRRKMRKNIIRKRRFAASKKRKSAAVRKRKIGKRSKHLRKVKLSRKKSKAALKRKTLKSSMKSMSNIQRALANPEWKRKMPKESEILDRSKEKSGEKRETNERPQSVKRKENYDNKDANLENRDTAVKKIFVKNARTQTRVSQNVNRGTSAITTSIQPTPTRNGELHSEYPNDPAMTRQQLHKQYHHDIECRKSRKFLAKVPPEPRKPLQQGWSDNRVIQGVDAPPDLEIRQNFETIF